MEKLILDYLHLTQPLSIQIPKIIVQKIYFLKIIDQIHCQSQSDFFKKLPINP